jgi:hypothetical protein
MWKPRHSATPGRQTSTTQVHGFIDVKPLAVPTGMNDLKQPGMDSEKGEAMLHHPSRPRSRRLLTGFMLVAFCYLFWSAASRFNVFHHLCGQHGVAPVSIKDAERALVPLEAHIMSKCPDAKVGSASNV